MLSIQLLISRKPLQAATGGYTTLDDPAPTIRITLIPAIIAFIVGASCVFALNVGGVLAARPEVLNTLVKHTADGIPMFFLGLVAIVALTNCRYAPGRQDTSPKVAEFVGAVSALGMCITAIMWSYSLLGTD